jgi:3-hydroxybutyryl-CoA dehydratase
MYKLGDTVKQTISFSEGDVKAFSELTGDQNPIHTDSEFALRTANSRMLVQGNFVISSFSRILGNLYPGETLVVSKQAMFIRPIFVGDTYSMSVKLTSVQISDNTALFTCILKDLAGKTCVYYKCRLKNSSVFKNGFADE